MPKDAHGGLAQALEKSRRREAELAERLELAELILDNIHNGVLVCDAHGVITHFNKPYGRFLGVDPAAQIGRHTTEVVENSRMHIVAQTGRAEINMSHSIKGVDMVVQRIPITKNGKIIAVFGQVMFKNVGDVAKLAKRLAALQTKVKDYEKELSSLRTTRYTMDSIIGVSRAISLLKQEAHAAATNDLPVLIAGESGTGKEVFAQAIHAASRRRHRPFIRINCAAIPKDLFESELFGYDKGAFTGASAQGKPGRFELAHGGTVFLDEVGELPLAMQPKLLRVLEEKEFERVGGTTLIKTDFRLIAATNQNLEQMLDQASFRKDLYYRLNVIPLSIDPLRRRREDIIPLACHFARHIHEGPGQAPRLSQEAIDVLEGYAWPGNVRELYNVMERVLASLEGEQVHAVDLPFYLHRTQAARPSGDHWALQEVVARAEREAIRHALAAARNNKALAAQMLGIHRTLLYKKIRKYGLPLQ